MAEELVHQYIENKILLIRNQQVMLDKDIAELYGVETKVLNQAVKRNIDRFPEDFVFQLTKDECSRSQFVTLNVSRGHNLKYMPYAYTEQGIAMLSGIIKSPQAVEVNIKIMRAFVAMRKFLLTNAQVFQRLDSIEKRQLETDQKIDVIFDKMDRYGIEDKQGIFFQGQIFDAYAKFEHFIQSAKNEIVLIDNYVDLSVLERLTKKQTGVKVTIYTQQSTRLTEQDITRFNSQYPTLELKFTSRMHDRFMIIDGETLYHIGASLKDLGKKCFAFEILDCQMIGLIMHNL
ncbi:MAG: ORF6N domain-containing protein [Bacteroidales bacterium]|nr:ORF6N domain-containing protein [Bacteroidales bacterium]